MLELSCAIVLRLDLVLKQKENESICQLKMLLILHLRVDWDYVKDGLGPFADCRCEDSQVEKWSDSAGGRRHRHALELAAGSTA